MLICPMLVVVISGAATAMAGPATRSSQVTPADLMARAAQATPTGPQSWAGHGSPNEPVSGAESDDASQPPRRRFSWPLAGAPSVVRTFHAPAFRYGPGHRGVDLAAQAGAPVLAADAGTVVFAGMVAGRGVVSVSHPGGLRTTYEPVSAAVAAGARISRGEQIGTVQPGHPGCPVMVCLHWGVFRSPEQGDPDPGDPGREYLDPLRLIITARVRLLPIDGLPDRP
jgi:murein DD-endopeptidase MepM/ murein hydrolase activator NlpD